MIFPSYFESIKDYILKNKNKKPIKPKIDVDDFSVSNELIINCQKFESNDKQIKFKFNQINETPIYESINENLNESSNCFSRSVITFKSDSPKSIDIIKSTKNSKSINCSKSFNNVNSNGTNSIRSSISKPINSSRSINNAKLKINKSSIVNQNDSFKRVNCLIKHECVEPKAIKTKSNRTYQSDTNSPQKCIHQRHPECLNLSSLDEGCLVCNGLILGNSSKIESTSFIDKTNDRTNQKQHNPLLNELRKLALIGWYWGKLSRFEAENKLVNTEPGTFLIRDSFDTNYVLSLSFRIPEGVFHTRIEYRAGHFHFYLHPNKKYVTVSSLVDDLIENSKTGIYYYVKSRKTSKEIQFKIKLDKPMSRFDQVRSLKHLCRFIIKQNIRYDLIQNLPIPEEIKEYLYENHF